MDRLCGDQKQNRDEDHQAKWIFRFDPAVAAIHCAN